MKEESRERSAPPVPGRYLAALLERLHGETAPEIGEAVQELCRQLAAGHVCLELGDSAPGDGVAQRARWRRTLEQSPVVGTPGSRQPLVLDAHGRLYLYRHWALESGLARALRRRAARPVACDRDRLAQGLERLFPAAAAPECPDRQRLAAALALLRPLCVISGGPGTGKTRTVARLLQLWLEQAGEHGSGGARFALTAPTGRAAARLGRMVAAEAARLHLAPALHNAPVHTLHRLLGARWDGSGFRYHRRHPLALDLVVVDEASMVDLELAAALLDALPETARLVLLGDKDQLASVEAGAVLAELCSGAEGYSPGLTADLAKLCPGRLPEAATPGFGESVVLLRRSHRFAADSGIAGLAEAVRAGDARAAGALLMAGDDPMLRFRSPARSSELADLLAAVLPDWLGPYLEAVRAGDPAAAAQALGTCRLLAAVREGPWGVSGLNRLVERQIQGRDPDPEASPWYPGRPVLVTRNHHARRLYNGDLGITLQAQGAPPRLYFESPGAAPRCLSPAMAPPHETAFAMTVHRAQGSEFDRVCLLLPPPGHSQLTRELLYTAITRARRGLEIWGTRAAVEQAAAHPARRSSGLGDLLRNPHDP